MNWLFLLGVFVGLIIGIILATIYWRIEISHAIETGLWTWRRRLYELREI